MSSEAVRPHGGESARQATLVLFGGTGDLALRKLLPALFRLWKRKLLEDCLIVGVGRRCADLAAYRALLAEKVADAAKEPEAWNAFAGQLGYHKGDIATRADFEALRQRIETLETERRMPGKRLFYYAVAPEFFGPVTEQLADVGLVRRAAETGDAWRRVIVEKPFGHDRASAAELDRVLRSRLDENQIFRIDHYLGKETVQNMLAFRFANGMFEPVWNYKYVASVQITVAESLGIGDRGGYYDETGAFKDMMQNHMLQLLALTAMEPPTSLDADAIRDEKVKALRAIRVPQSAEEVAASTVRGQYRAGKVDGQPAAGYLQEKGVAADSRTPSYVAARLYLDNWRWANVPFLLRHGKRLPKRGTEIAIQFTTPPLSLFRGTGVFEHCTNMLVIRIQPHEGIELHFGAKTPGAGMRLANVKMDFDYEKEFHQELPEAYERLLLDALLGDPTLFTRSDEVAAMWRWADAVIGGWNGLSRPVVEPYDAGSWGPAEAESLFPDADHISTGLCPISWRRW